MAVQFILGRSGTGKTSCCIKAIVDALLEPKGKQLILLVPEQASYQAERAILSDKRVAGYNRLNVLSFDRLQFLLLGKNTARPELSRIGQQMIVQRILREVSSKLKVFRQSANWPGLGRQMAQTIAELHQYTKTPDDIERLVKELEKDEKNNLAGLKFADIGLVFKEYLKFIEGRFIDSDIQLTNARRAVAEAAFVKGAKLWVDGFAGFTASELAMLAELLKVVSEVKIALCLDASNIDLTNPDAGGLDPAGLFNPTERTYAALVEIVKKCRLRLAEPVILTEAVRFSKCPQLAHIEQDIFETEPAKTAAADNIHVVSAANARCEVQFVARKIVQLVREKDFRYRDIAVIASDIEQYQHYIRAYFDDYGIPFFIDKRKPLNQHPAVQLICSALEVVTDGFLHSDIFNYLKTDLVPIDRRDIDVLENYCLAFGVTGSDWADDKKWEFAEEGDEKFDERHVNEIRDKVRVPLIELRDKLAGGNSPAEIISAAEFTRAVFNFLDALGVREKIGEWIEDAGEKDDFAGIDEHRQFYERLINLFDELAEVFAGQAMSCKDYLAILSSAFSQLTMAFIPPSLDQVLVGSIERSRHPDLKAAFLIGATQKQFPVPVGFERVLTDDDRRAAEAADFPLAATVSQMLAERQYLAYIAFTRPSQFLWVSYPLADDKGGATTRSQFAGNLEALFENLVEESVAVEQIEIEKVNSRTELVELLCSRLGKDSMRTKLSNKEQLGELLEDICADEQLAGAGSTVLCAINYDNSAKLDKQIVEGLFGRRIKSSATKLSTFAQCPYQHFARYILELEERKELKFEPLDVGTFYHRILDGLLKKLNDENKDFATAETEEILKVLREQILKLVKEDSFISNFARHSAHNAFIIHSAGETLEDCVSAIAEMVRAGSFKPVLSEVLFGEAGKGLGEYELTLSNGRQLFLSGKIDRLDVANLDGKKIAAVFDYKLKGRTFSWQDFFNGLNMQLPIYMSAVRNAHKAKGDLQYLIDEAIGAFYMPVELKLPKVKFGELEEQKDQFDYKAKGLFNGEFAQQLDAKTVSGWSGFYNFCVTQKENQYGRYDKSGALKPDDFEKVLEFTRRKIIELSEEIVSGRIDVQPYKLGTESACSYCKYKTVCRFDWQINDYNFLESLTKAEFLKKMGGG